MLNLDFENQLDSSVNNFTLRNIYSDWLIDNNNFYYANVQRWLKIHSKCPKKEHQYYYWYNDIPAVRRKLEFGIDYYGLEPKIFNCLPIVKNKEDCYFVTYITRYDAEKELALALKECGIIVI